MPAISPAHLSFLKGTLFKTWEGNALVSGLASQVIVRILIDDGEAREVERYDMGTRIRSAMEGADGTIWVLEDERGNSQGRLLKLIPG